MFSRILHGNWDANAGKKPTVAKLGNTMGRYWDANKGRWVKNNETPEEAAEADKALTPPPPPCSSNEIVKLVDRGPTDFTSLSAKYPTPEYITQRSRTVDNPPRASSVQADLYTDHQARPSATQEPAASQHIFNPLGPPARASLTQTRSHLSSELRPSPAPLVTPPDPKRSMPEPINMSSTGTDLAPPPSSSGGDDFTNLGSHPAPPVDGGFRSGSTVPDIRPSLRSAGTDSLRVSHIPGRAPEQIQQWAPERPELPAPQPVNAPYPAFPHLGDRNNVSPPLPPISQQLPDVSSIGQWHDEQQAIRRPGQFHDYQETFGAHMSREAEPAAAGPGGPPDGISRDMSWRYGMMNQAPPPLPPQPSLVMRPFPKAPVNKPGGFVESRMRSKSQHAPGELGEKRMSIPEPIAPQEDIHLQSAETGLNLPPLPLDESSAPQLAHGAFLHSQRQEAVEEMFLPPPPIGLQEPFGQVPAAQSEEEVQNEPHRRSHLNRRPLYPPSHDPSIGSSSQEAAAVDGLNAPPQTGTGSGQEPLSALDRPSFEVLPRAQMRPPAYPQEDYGSFSPRLDGPFDSNAHGGAFGQGDAENSVNDEVSHYSAIQEQFLPPVENVHDVFTTLDNASPSGYEYRQMSHNRNGSLAAQYDIPPPPFELDLSQYERQDSYVQPAGGAPEEHLQSMGGSHALSAPPNSLDNREGAAAGRSAAPPVAHSLEHVPPPSQEGGEEDYLGREEGIVHRQTADFDGHWPSAQNDSFFYPPPIPGLPGYRRPSMDSVSLSQACGNVSEAGTDRRLKHRFRFSGTVRTTPDTTLQLERKISYQLSNLLSTLESSYIEDPEGRDLLSQLQEANDGLAIDVAKLNPNISKRLEAWNQDLCNGGAEQRAKAAIANLSAGSQDTTEAVREVHRLLNDVLTNYQDVVAAKDRELKKFDEELDSAHARVRDLSHKLISLNTIVPSIVEARVAVFARACREQAAAREVELNAETANRIEQLEKARRQQVEQLERELSVATAQPRAVETEAAATLKAEIASLKRVLQDEAAEYKQSLKERDDELGRLRAAHEGELELSKTMHENELRSIREEKELAIRELETQLQQTRADAAAETERIQEAATKREAALSAEKERLGKLRESLEYASKQLQERWDQLLSWQTRAKAAFQNLQTQGRKAEAFWAKITGGDAAALVELQGALQVAAEPFPGDQGGAALPISSSGVFS